jgi:hypothetical protein
MKNTVYIVFDFKTPNGFLPFCYTKNSIDALLEYNLKNKKEYDILPGTNKILTFNLDERNINDEDLYIILIDSKLKEIEIESILSPKLNFLYNSSDNFIIHYFDYGIEQMRSLI